MMPVNSDVEVMNNLGNLSYLDRPLDKLNDVVTHFLVVKDLNCSS